MESGISGINEPKLLQLTLWLQTKMQQNATVTVQVGTRCPLTKKDYMPMNKVYFYDLVTNGELPVFLVAYNDLKIPIDVGLYSFCNNEKIGDDEVIMHFALNFVTSTRDLEKKYCNLKEDTDKLARAEGLNNFIRTETEFLSLYERNEDIEQIRVAELEEEKHERYICNQILKVKKNKLDFKNIIILVILFTIFGYLLQAISGTALQRKREARRNAEKKKPKPSKNKRKLK